MAIETLGHVVANRLMEQFVRDISTMLAECRIAVVWRVDQSARNPTMKTTSVIAAACASSFLLLAANVRADSLDDIRQRGTLRWGGDKEGGAPFVYPTKEDPTQVEGCDVEMAEILAKKLGVRQEFVQGQWEKLPDVLDRGDIDIVLTGYEWTESRRRRYGVSIPYYIYELQFLARRDDASLRSIDQLRVEPGKPKRRVSVLGGSAAQIYLQENFGDDIEIVSFDGITDAMEAVKLATDGIDANLQDLPIVTFYENGFPTLARIGDPVGLGYYVVLTRKGDTRLLMAINDALNEMLRDGSLRQIHERYRMWNITQGRRALELDKDGCFTGIGLKEHAAPDDAESYEAERGWPVIVNRAPLLLKAAWMTVKLSVISMPLAITIGLLIALGRLYGPKILGKPLALYVELIRGTPLILQLYVVFFLLPQLGVNVPAFWAAIIGLAVNYSAYEAEIYRAGLQAIPRGQMEAAIALGMSRGLALRRIIVPQATRIVIPPVTNDFIALFKDTATCSVITVVELSKEYYIHARNTGAIVELGIITAVLYLAMSYPLSLLTNYMERRMARERRT
jgi:polar amino acid transport system substrate-binding protein